MSDLLVAGGGDAGLGFVGALQPVGPPAAFFFLLLPLARVLLVVLMRLAAVLHLGLPCASLPQEALVDLQLLARLLPAITAFDLQLLDARLDVLDVVRGDPCSAEMTGNKG